MCILRMLSGDAVEVFAGCFHAFSHGFYIENLVGVGETAAFLVG